MLADNKNFREASHIGDELLNNKELVMRSQCLAVGNTVSTGVLTLEKALRIYKVPFDTYVSFDFIGFSKEVEEGKVTLK